MIIIALYDILGDNKNVGGKDMNSKIGIVGLGHVGSQVLTEVMQLGIFREIVGIDIIDNLAEGEALDHQHTLSLYGTHNVHVKGGTIADLGDADVIIVAAGESIKQGSEKPDRTKLTETSARVIRDVMDQIAKVTKDAIIIMITNPLDTMLYIAQTEFDYPKDKIFGTGTTLDSARLRSVISNYYNVDAKNVQANMLGEHGMTAFPAFSKITIDGIPLTEYSNLVGKDLINEDEVKDYVVQVANDVLNYKGYTNAGIAKSAATLAKAVILDERSVFPVCTVIDKEYGYSGDVAFSIPTMIGKEGVIQKLEVALNEKELGLLHDSAAFIKEIIAKAKAVQ